MGKSTNIELMKMKEQVKCSKKHRCIHEPIESVCRAKYTALADMMECLDEHPEKCEYSRPFANKCICSCPLRKYIAVHFEDMS